MLDIKPHFPGTGHAELDSLDFIFAITKIFFYPWLGRKTMAMRRHATEDFERQYLKTLFARSKGRVNRAAQDAGISSRQLNKLMVKYGIQKEAFKD